MPLLLTVPAALACRSGSRRTTMSSSPRWCATLPTLPRRLPTAQSALPLPQCRCRRLQSAQPPSRCRPGSGFRPPHRRRVHRRRLRSSSRWTSASRAATSCRHARMSTAEYAEYPRLPCQRAQHAVPAVHTCLARAVVWAVVWLVGCGDCMATLPRAARAEVAVSAHCQSPVGSEPAGFGTKAKANQTRTARVALISSVRRSWTSPKSSASRACGPPMRMCNMPIDRQP